MKKFGLFSEDRARQIARYIASMGVSAVILDLDIEFITIEGIYDRNADIDGYCRYADWRALYESKWQHDPSSDRLHAQRTVSRTIISHYAPLATLEKLGELDDESWETARVGIESLVEFLIKHSLIPESFRTPDLYEEYLAEIAAEMIHDSECWRCIDVVAERLMKEIELSEEEIIEIMDNALALEQ